MTGLDARPAVVLGVGNVLRRDDGVGVRVLEQLRRLASRDASALPNRTRLVDGGTLGLDLLEEVGSAGTLLLVDALDLGLTPGTIRVLRGDEILAAAMAGQGSIGEGVGELLSLARLQDSAPAAVALVGVQVGDTGFGEGLTPAVASAVPAAVAAACGELREFTGLTPSAARGRHSSEGATP